MTLAVQKKHKHPNNAKNSYEIWLFTRAMPITTRYLLSQDVRSPVCHVPASRQNG